MWQEIIHETCVGLNVEPSVTNRSKDEEVLEVEFRCPRELTRDEKRSILRHLPEGIETVFRVGPKNATLNFILSGMQMAGVHIEEIKYAIQDRALLVTTVGQVAELQKNEIYLTGFLQMLQEDGAVDEWDIVCRDASGKDHVIHSDVKSFVPPSPKEMKAIMKKFVMGRLQSLVEKTKDDTRAEAKPERTTRISDDDVLNLKISLETAQDVNDFLKGLE